jgi:hypothetical protein
MRRHVSPRMSRRGHREPFPTDGEEPSSRSLNEALAALSSAGITDAPPPPPPPPSSGRGTRIGIVTADYVNFRSTVHADRYGERLGSILNRLSVGADNEQAPVYR